MVQSSVGGPILLIVAVCYLLVIVPIHLFGETRRECETAACPWLLSSCSDPSNYNMCRAAGCVLCVDSKTRECYHPGIACTDRVSIDNFSPFALYLFRIWNIVVVAAGGVAVLLVLHDATGLA